MSETLADPATSSGGAAGGAGFGGLSDDALIDALVGCDREQAVLDARRARILAAIATHPWPNSDGSPAPDRAWASEEVALVLRLSGQTARAMLEEAAELVTRFPATLQRLEAGELSYRQAMRLVEACRSLDEDTAARVEERVLARAGEQSLAQFSATVRRAVARLAPQAAEDAHAAAIDRRRVVISTHPGGTGELWALLPAPQLAAAQARIRELVHHWRTEHPADERSLPQREADALLALLLGDGDAAAAAVRPVVHVTVALSTLLALDDQPGELDGHGPIPATLARTLAADPTGTWRRLLTDADNRLVDLSVRTYRPPTAMARLVKAQHPTCCFPGCRRRAHSSELDHITPWADGGPTTSANLQPLCARHHHVKHDDGWRVHRDPEGTTAWTSPTTGRTYTRPPDDDHLPHDRTMHPPDNDQPAA